MPKSKRLLIIGVITLGIAASLEAGFKYLDSEPFGLSSSTTIAKAWWPAWDTFQIGVKQKEKVKKTHFLQKQEYSEALAAFENGSADAATLTIYEALLAAEKGIQLKIVLLLDYTNGSDAILAQPHINNLSELRGKRIGVEMGTIAHFTLLKGLKKAGIKSSEATLVPLSLNELKNAFINNKIDALSIYEPYLSELKQAKNAKIIFSSMEIPRTICDVLFAHESVLKQNPGLIKHWTNAWYEALHYKISQPSAYYQVLSGLNKISITKNRDAFRGIYLANLRENELAFGTVDKPGYLLDALEDMHSFLLQEKVIEKPIDLKSLLYYEGISQVEG